jgi:hypothetical protein
MMPYCMDDHKTREDTNYFMFISKYAIVYIFGMLGRHVQAVAAVPSKTGDVFYEYGSITFMKTFNPLNAELNSMCHLLALLGVHHFLHVSRIRVKSLNLRLLMSYIPVYIWSTYS